MPLYQCKWSEWKKTLLNFERKYIFLNFLLLVSSFSTSEVHGPCQSPSQDPLDRSPTAIGIEVTIATLVYFAAVFGNPLVIYVLNKDFRLHTVTSTFIYNLAFTDTTTATTYMPFWMVTLYTGTWNVSQLWCQLSKSILTTTCYTSLNYGFNGSKSIHYRCKTCTVQKIFLQQKSS